jgi:hypothetical protein
MGYVNLPTPVALTGGALCLLGGYFVGAITGPDNPGSSTTAEVKSYDTSSGQLCLTGDAVDQQPGVKDGELCGVWRRYAGDRLPRAGDDFRFVSVVSSQGSNSATYIYGSVVR